MAAANKKAENAGEQMAEVFRSLGENVDAITSIGLLITAVGGLIGFLLKLKRDSIENERKIYDNIDNRYFEILKISMEYPNTDLSWFSDGSIKELSQEESIQRDIGFEMITRLFELVFINFTKAGSSQRKRQWIGWDDFISDFCKKKSYREWWNKIEWPLRNFDGKESFQYDVDFEAYIIGKFKSENDAFRITPDKMITSANTDIANKQETKNM